MDNIFAYPHVFSGLLNKQFRYTVNYKIGQGVYGKVYDARDNTTGKKVAIKIIELSSSDDFKMIFREISLLRMLNGNPNIVSLEYAAASESNIFSKQIALVFERIDTNLASIIQSRQTLTEKHIKYFMYQILLGINALKQFNIVHRDLKPLNILISKDCRIKICDFGMSRVDTDVFKNVTGYVVTRWYRAPEVILNHRAIHPSDIWSVGCIFAELILGRPLFYGKQSSPDLLHSILNLFELPVDIYSEFLPGLNSLNHDRKVRYTSNSSATLKNIFLKSNIMQYEFGFDLLTQLLKFLPAERISVDAALRHPFLSEFFKELDLTHTSTHPRSGVAEESYKRLHSFEVEIERNLREHGPFAGEFANTNLARSNILNDLRLHNDTSSSLISKEPLIPSSKSMDSKSSEVPQDLARSCNLVSESERESAAQDFSNEAICSTRQSPIIVTATSTAADNNSASAATAASAAIDPSEKALCEGSLDAVDSTEVVPTPETNTSILRPYHEQRCTFFSTLTNDLRDAKKVKDSAHTSAISTLNN